jgi:hypothetical protein
MCPHVLMPIVMDLKFIAAGKVDMSVEVLSKRLGDTSLRFKYFVTMLAN